MFTLTVYVQPSHRRASRAAAKVQGAEARKRAAGYRPHPKGVYAANHTASGPKGQQAQPRMSGLSLASQPDEYKASTWRHVIGCQESAPKAGLLIGCRRCAGAQNTCLWRTQWDMRWHRLLFITFKTLCYSEHTLNSNTNRKRSFDRSLRSNRLLAGIHDACSGAAQQSLYHCEQRVCLCRLQILPRHRALYRQLIVCYVAEGRNVELNLTT